jgi:hypothetical protein
MAETNDYLMGKYSLPWWQAYTSENSAAGGLPSLSAGSSAALTNATTGVGTGAAGLIQAATGNDPNSMNGFVSNLNQLAQFTDALKKLGINSGSGPI